jgi:hypothetical protein
MSKTLNKTEYPMTITGRLLPVTVAGECGDTAILNSGERDSLNHLVTNGTEVNNTQSQSKKRGQYTNDSKENRKNAALKGLQNKTAKAVNNSLANLKSDKKHISKKTKEERSLLAKNRAKNLVLTGKEIERRKKISETMKSKVKTKEHLENIAKTKQNWSQEKRDAIFRDEKRNNKISASRKKFLAENEAFKEKMIERFINAPKYNKLPNKPEINVINLDVKNLEYTGDGKYFVTLSNNRKKNPDFIVKGNNTRAKAVVELMDFEYWHHVDEITAIPSLYNEKGIECLVIDAARCYKKDDLFQVKNEIQNFIDGLK